jgi:hypothetical protein
MAEASDRGAAPSSLDELIQDIIEDPGYADGSRQADADITGDEAMLVLEDFYATHDQADAVIPRVAAAMGKQVACRAGCGECCVSMVLVSVPEALLVARWLAEPEQSQILAEFRPRAAAWMAAAGERAGQAAEACAAGDTQLYRKLTFQHANSRQMCACNHDGACAIYPVRPLPCRRVWVADTNEYCLRTIDPTRPHPELLSFDGFEKLIEQGSQLTAGMQHVMGLGTRREPLISRVLALLDELD